MSFRLSMATELEASRRHDNRNLPVPLAYRAHGDLDVLAQLGQELHEALGRKDPRPVAHQGRDVRLLDAEDLAGLGLGQPTILDQLVDLQREARLQQLLFGMGRSRSANTLPLPFSARILLFFFLMVGPAFLGSGARRPPTAAGSARCPSAASRCPS
jgi:hypothetical protein